MRTDILNDQLHRTVRVTDFDHLGKRYQGKVRDTYAQDDRLILITTDRISAFDRILNQTIPFKGQVLNQLAAHFFEATSDVVPNHVLAVPDPNVTVAIRCDAVPVEFVVRGYLVGHAWRVYRSGNRTLCGNSLPEGLKQNSRFATPLLTPTTKATQGHDEDISRDEIIRQGLLDEDTFDTLAGHAMRLFQRGTDLAARQGLILVDTKYEFGIAPGGGFVVIDEVHTPDSSRYFYADSYVDLLKADEPQRQLSKEFVREWLMQHDFMGLPGQRLPDLPDSFRVEVAARYIELFEKITGRAFEPDSSADPLERIRENLASLETTTNIA
jgi:phosphoribosylaminoimidazole-succinocarboxamide synthase